jgi:methionine-rich copper-binding protein CopC
MTPGTYDFFGVVAHEISEVMGRIFLLGSSIGGTANSYDAKDLFHFSAPGVRSFTGTQPGYFSVNNGTTNLDNFNTNSNGDFGDWAASAGNDAALAFSNSGVVNAFSQTDTKLMDVLVWDNTAAGPDTTPPTLSTSSPADNSTNIAVGANLVLTFSENVKAGSGNLVIHNALDGSAVATIAITDASQMSFAGSVLTINPTSDLALGTHYYLTMASGVVQDLAGNAYAGLSANTDFDFTTGSPADTTPPTLSTTTPADNSTNVAVGANLVLTFSESVKAGSGNVVIHNALDGSVVATIAISDASQVSFAGAALTINPTSDLALGTHYYVTMASGVVQDLAGNAYAGLSANTDFDFTTTTAAPLKVRYDFDSDGHSDILLQSDSGQAAVWLMNGTSILANGNVGAADPTWHVKSAGDFDGDGKADILWQNDSGQPQIWLMNGTNVLSSGTIAENPGTTWHVKGAGDFNGDGKSDILWQNDSGQAAVWLMNGTTLILGNVIGSSPGVSWHIKGAGDFNGDGKSDILWQNDSGQAMVWLMNGLSLLSNPNVGSNPGPSWHVKGAEDFNGDGKADILWQDDSGQAMVWLMNGTTVLTTGNVGANPGSPWHVTSNDHTAATTLSSGVADTSIDPSSGAHASPIDQPFLFDGHLIF